MTSIERSVVTPAPTSVWRRPVALVAKVAVTMLVFYLLLSHSISMQGVHQPVWRALAERAQGMDWSRAWVFLLAAAVIKAVGIACAMLRWHVLLVGQAIRFPFRHVATTFLIGRFVGTFLPGTIGLDGYKLYDAARFSGRKAEPAAATMVEKLLGVTGIWLTYLLAAPFGYAVLGGAAPLILGLTLPLGLFGVVVVFWLLLRPAPLVRLLTRTARWAPRRAQNPSSVNTSPLVAAPHELPLCPQTLATRFASASGAYAGKGHLLLAAVGLSLGVHFTTAALYYFTALAVGATQARFGEVVFASSIQIFATVVSPLTVAGEGVREAVQALLLAERLGAPESILSAALGFWAAEALTLVGGYLWWRRGPAYRPS